MNENGMAIVYLNDTWENFIGYFSPTEGYKVKVDSNTNLTITGLNFANDINVGLINGWNIISYPKSDTLPAEEILGKLINEGSLLKVQNETGLSIEDVNPIGWINNIEDSN